MYLLLCNVFYFLVSSDDFYFLQIKHNLIIRKQYFPIIIKESSTEKFNNNYHFSIINVHVPNKI